MKQINSDKVYKLVILTLFTFVFIYLLLRVLYLDPLHDEIATYMFYFYQGDYIGEYIHWDANNHLLNSYIGHKLYGVFGDNIPVLRLPNLLAFVFYFWGTVRLTRDFKTPYLKLTSLIALNTIPFIIEYFGVARGYGLSIGFFVWGIAHLLHYLNSPSVKALFFSYLFMGLAVSANLTLMNTCLITLGLAVIAPFLSAEKRPLKTKVWEWALHLGFIVGLCPFVAFGLGLKNAGALYYGSLDGIWDVTGKTLSEYILFIKDDWLRFVYLFLFAGFITYAIILIRKMKRHEWLQRPYLVYVIVFFGNILAILILAFVFEVNYPEDRTGMYLAVLFLFLVFNLLDAFKFGKWAQIALFFFPIGFIASVNLETSIFSPDDRMNQGFYDEVKKHIKPEHSLMIYPIMNWNWPYKESHSKVKASVGLFYNPQTTLTDILITKTNFLKNPDVSRLYDTIAVHEPSFYVAFKRKQALLKNSVEELPAVSAKTHEEFIDIGEFEGASLDNKDLQISISGHLKTKELKNKLLLYVHVTSKNDPLGEYYYYSFETVYQSQLIDDDFLHHFVLEDRSEKEKKIKVYLWNRGLHFVNLSNTRCLLSELKAPKNESR
jgi:hypothetical protein